MKLLFIIPYAPTRIRTRPHYFLRSLARKGHHITLATLYQNDEESHALKDIESWGVKLLSFPMRKTRTARSLLQAALEGLPFQARFNWDPRLASAIASELVRGGPYDLVHVEHLRGAVYGTAARESAGANPLPVVWDSVDSISHLFQQSAAKSASPFGRITGRIELGRTKKYEAEMVRAFDRVLVTSKNDRSALMALVKAAPVGPEHICVMPNGVDRQDFRPIPDTEPSNAVVFTGKMSYHANITAVAIFVRNILPLIWRERPETEFWIVGKDPGRKIKSLAQDGRIRVFGTVPEISPILGAAAVSVAPIAYGAGIQNKVLEAMACRVPVVCSPQAVSALGAKHSVELMVGETPEAFAGAVVDLLENHTYRQQIAEAGYNYVITHHDWDKLTSDLEAVYYETIHSLA